MTEDGESVRDAGFDEFLDALAEGDSYYVECANGHGSLPPRRVCPECGSADLAETPLPESGEVATYTKVHVPAPSFADDAPYVTAVVDFGPVRLTGQVLADVEDVEIGLKVEPVVSETETRGERLVVFEPR
ncbi:Zn-ribbon domain-containing OB-fold protein [Halobacterium noricense]|uniref:Zn-ribbon domain-containing OB-fold protein n=1 Tax=Halobacterium noricense TaxID=223182 RepID=UPI001E3D9F94|nr:Zn-ribbon domain-containing OB-fold protein [Halobacterium noricense]UHH25942.1 Zn-ribbon domain-containing OB-fold protein [Halobacterium noricense]